MGENVRIRDRFRWSGSGAGVEKEDTHSRQAFEFRAPLTVQGYVCLSLFLAIATVMAWVFADQALAGYFRENPLPLLHSTYAILARLGEAQWYLLAGLALFLVFRKRNKRLARIGLYLIAVVAATGVAVNVAKLLVGRCRPREWVATGAMELRPLSLATEFRSFPSGHATTIVSGLAAVGIGLGRAYFWVLLGIGFALMFGRVVTLDHFLSDVLAGAWFGLTGAYFLSGIVPKKKNAASDAQG